MIVEPAALRGSSGLALIVTSTIMKFDILLTEGYLAAYIIRQRPNTTDLPILPVHAERFNEASEAYIWMAQFLWLAIMKNSRRAFISSIGVSGIVGLAGCIGGSNEGASTANTVAIGLQGPLSGAYSATGSNLVKGVEHAIDQATNEGLVDDVELLTSDSEVDSQVASSNAREFANNGADVQFGGITGHVTEAAAREGGREKLITFGMGTGYSTEVNNCFDWHFKTGWTIASHAEGSVGYAVRNGMGSNIYDITSDFEWGHSMSDYLTDVLKPEAGANVVDNPVVPVGTSEYSQYLQAAMNSDAEIVQLNLYGTDAVAATNQAYDIGALDQMKIMVSVITPSMASATNPEALNHDNLYYNVSWLPFEDNSESREFFDYYQNNYDDAPPVPPQEVTWHYTAAYTYLNAVSEEGTTDSETIREALRGRSLEPAIWPFDTRWRKEDQLLLAPAITMQGISGDAAYGPENVVEVITDEDRLAFAPEKTACNFV